MQRNLKGENGDRERETRPTNTPFFSFFCCCNFLCKQIKKHHVYHFVSEKVEASVKIYFLQKTNVAQPDQSPRQFGTVSLEKILGL
jgi:hypothetical protein